MPGAEQRTTGGDRFADGTPITAPISRAVGGVTATEHNVRGFSDLIVADSKQQTSSHLRLGNRLFKRAHANEAEKQLIRKLQGKLPEGAIPCMRDGTFLGCLRLTGGIGCEFHHGWKEHLTEAQVKSVKMYYAWCCAKGDGL